MGAGTANRNTPARAVQDISTAEIRRAFRAASLRFHPDKVGMQRGEATGAVDTRACGVGMRTGGDRQKRKSKGSRFREWQEGRAQAAKAERERKFLRVQQARAVLCDRKRRKLYDDDIRACATTDTAAGSSKAKPRIPHMGTAVGAQAALGLRECVRQRECVRTCDASYRAATPLSEFSASAEHRRRVLRVTCVERCVQQVQSNDKQRD